MHKLSISKTTKGTEIKLDGFSLQGVTGYKTVGSVDGATELTVCLLVSVAEFGADNSANNRGSDLSNCT